MLMVNFMVIFMVIYSHFHGDLYQWNQKPMICGGYFCLADFFNGDFSMVIPMVNFMVMFMVIL